MNVDCIFHPDVCLIVLFSTIYSATLLSSVTMRVRNAYLGQDQVGFVVKVWTVRDRKGSHIVVNA